MRVVAWAQDPIRSLEEVRARAVEAVDLAAGHRVTRQVAADIAELLERYLGDYGLGRGRVRDNARKAAIGDALEPIASSENGDGQDDEVTATRREPLVDTLVIRQRRHVKCTGGKSRVKGILNRIDAVDSRQRTVCLDSSGDGASDETYANDENFLEWNSHASS